MEIITPEIAEQRALTVPEQAKAITITDNATLLQANEILLNIKDIRKQIDEAFDPIIKKAYEAHKEACSQKKRAEAPLIEAEGILKPQISSYVTEQERKRREEEERLRQIALKAEEERRLAEAVQLEKEGKKEEAETVLAEPTFVPPPILEKATPKLNGTSIRTDYDFEIINEALIPRQYMTPNLTAIRAVVKSLKDKSNIPGIRVIQKQIVASGRR